MHSFAGQVIPQMDSTYQESSKNTNQFEIEEPSTVEFLKNTWGTLNFWIVVSLLGANFLIYLYNCILPFSIKNKDKKLEWHKLIISKKIKYIEDIHSLMREISDNILFLVPTQNELVAKLTKMNTYSGMYFKQETKELITRFIDAAVVQDKNESLKYREQFEELYRKGDEL